MKRFFSVLLILVLISPAMAQCDDPFMKTVAVYYGSNSTDDAISAEMGFTGSVSNFNAHIGLSAIHRVTDIIKGDSAYVTTAMYTKFGYRVLRWDYKLSVYAITTITLDMDRGAYPSIGLKFLKPVGRLAFILEPIINKFGPTIQAGFSLII